MRLTDFKNTISELFSGKKSSHESTEKNENEYLKPKKFVNRLIEADARGELLQKTVYASANSSYDKSEGLFFTFLTFSGIHATKTLKIWYDRVIDAITYLVHAIDPDMNTICLRKAFKQTIIAECSAFVDLGQSKPFPGQTKNMNN
ncbi:putative metalloprotease [Methanomicrobium sp. W14]|uniref:hypothetical protein n=1 Tax=Methanomicrobium sp. W14 TaxID=2817839 RepID=UPI001AE8CC08|nr:hypothetical protein [Methanomicrobium sp. W14]MBP2133716.1 putative metalloprotease [Methanomicrobium sp. W14]